MNVVLLEPEIHWNTGNIGRTCAATGTALHLIEPLGFKIDAQQIRRAGMDYWPKLKLSIHKDFFQFEASLPAEASLLFFSSHGERTFWEAPYRADSYLVFGKESSGFPPELRERFKDRTWRVPILKDTRSLNLSSCAAVALYEGLRRTGFFC